MKIGVISDTHISPEPDGCYGIDRSISVNPDQLCEVINEYFKDVDAVLHAGDITDLSVIDALERFGQVFAVAGNMDSSNTHRILGDKKIISFNGCRIGLIHGWGAKDDLPLRVRESFKPEKVNCIVFGHSHNPYDKIEDGILMFNPGSPTDKRFADHRSIGILHIDNGIWGEHIALD